MVDILKDWFLFMVEFLEGLLSWAKEHPILILLICLIFGAYFVLKWAFIGVLLTFRRQPVVAILCIIFLFPIYLCWVVIEVIFYYQDPDKPI